MFYRTLHYRLSVLAFIAPAMVLFLVLVFYPVMQSFITSFYRWNGIGTATLIGFDNYRRLLRDASFSTASRNGFIIAAILVVYQIGLGTVLTLALMDKKIRGRKFLKASYFIPVVLSITVVCQLWLFVYRYDGGLLNSLFRVAGLDYQQAWLSDHRVSIIAVAFVNAWQYLGIHFILIYTAVESIPPHYFEAARIDGASTSQIHRTITLPFLAETFRFCLILAITGGLRAFENMFIMTGGGPGTATYTITYHMYSAAFRANQYGYACASASVLVIQCLVLTVLINRFVARERITF